MLRDKLAQEDRATNLRDNAAQECCMKNLHRKTAQQTYATMPRKNAARHCGVSTWSFSLLSTLFLNKNGAIKKNFFCFCINS